VKQQGDAIEKSMKLSFMLAAATVLVTLKIKAIKKACCAL
jgi:hypothetical protein